MATASLACIPCVQHLWGAPTIRVWATAGGLAGFMLLVHLTIIQSMSAMTSDRTAMGATSGGHHIASRLADPATIHQSGSEILTYLATGLALGQAGLAAVVVAISVKRRDRKQGVIHSNRR
ncbi:hypothetical protein QM600_00310 [Rhodococcus sp. IEGM 1379]|nr:hypothetical protein [Rhodococcus sp. IEGM 1379]